MSAENRPESRGAGFVRKAGLDIEPGSGPISPSTVVKTESSVLKVLSANSKPLVVEPEGRGRGSFTDRRPSTLWAEILGDSSEQTVVAEMSSADMARYIKNQFNPNKDTVDVLVAPGQRVRMSIPTEPKAGAIKVEPVKPPYSS